MIRCFQWDYIGEEKLYYIILRRENNSTFFFNIYVRKSSFIYTLLKNKNIYI
jgi:hypothetical protein